MFSIHGKRFYYVRYLLTDTPETSHPQLGKQPFGDEAKERDCQLVSSGQVSVEFDVGQRYDKYDRLLAYIYVDGRRPEDANRRRTGPLYPPNTRHLTSYEEAQACAKAKGISINYATDSVFNGSVPSSSSSNNSSTSGSSSNASRKRLFIRCAKLYGNGMVPELRRAEEGLPSGCAERA